MNIKHLAHRFFAWLGLEVVMVGLWIGGWGEPKNRASAAEIKDCATSADPRTVPGAQDAKAPRLAGPITTAPAVAPPTITESPQPRKNLELGKFAGISSTGGIEGYPRKNLGDEFFEADLTTARISREAQRPREIDDTSQRIETIRRADAAYRMYGPKSWCGCSVCRAKYGVQT